MVDIEAISGGVSGQVCYQVQIRLTSCAKRVGLGCEQQQRNKQDEKPASRHGCHGVLCVRD